MPLAPDLPAGVRDRIARNAINEGRYFLVTFHNGETDPITLTRGLTQKDWYTLKAALEAVELDPV